ncbi:MAG: hypothetical protein H7Y20_04295 [Bryobacteraceae bacterium]|nr:hypothetical protein [Bryobacteraceae bacterium]
MKLENGLVLSVPAEGYETEKTTDGLRLRPSNWRSVRSPSEILVELRNTMPEGQFDSRRRLDHGDASFRIDTAPGGSGGEERTLHAWISHSSRFVYLQATTQSEDSRDSAFDLSWHVLNSARLEK